MVTIRWAVVLVMFAALVSLLSGCPEKRPEEGSPTYPADYQTDGWESMEKGELTEEAKAAKEAKEALDAATQQHDEDGVEIDTDQGEP